MAFSDTERLVGPLVLEPSWSWDFPKAQLTREGIWSLSWGLSEGVSVILHTGSCLALNLLFPVGCLPRHPWAMSLAPTNGQCEHSHLPAHVSLCLLASLLAWPESITQWRRHC